MPWALAAAAIPAVIGVAGSAIQANATSSAADKANKTQADALAASRASQAPYTNAGAGAIQQQQNLLGLNGQDAATAAMGTFQASPGYKYQVDQGLSAIDNGAASRGTLRSGNTLRAEQELGGNLANQDFGNYYNRLAGISGLGQNAAAGVGNQGVQTAAGQAQTDASAGNAMSGIYGNAARGVGNAINTGYNNYIATNPFGQVKDASNSGGGTNGYKSTFLGNNSNGADVMQGMGFYNPLPQNALVS